MTVSATRYVGEPVRRREDMRMLTGKGRYIDDVKVPGMLYAAFLRSPHPNARVTNVDIKPALGSPGVVAAFALADLVPAGKADTILGIDGGLFPPLASGHVAFVGDPVAIVCAESRAEAEDGCELILVDYEVMPAAVTIDDGLSETGPPVHPGAANLVGTTRAAERDGLEEAFRDASWVVEEEIAQHRYVACPMETRGVVASWQAFPPHMTIWISTQGAHAARDHFAALLELPAPAVRVLVGDVGGAFGQKIQVGREEGAVVLAARLVNRPIKWIEDRWENLTAAPHAREERGTVSMALDADGIITALRIEHFENSGSYGRVVGGDMVPRLITGPYRVAASGGSTTRIRSNTSRRLAYRGPWLFETVAREILIDIAARRIGMDPLELRRRNLLDRGDLPYTSPTGQIFDDVTPLQTLEQAAAMLDYEDFRALQAREREKGRYLGVGLSVYVEPTAMPFGLGATDSCTIRIDPSGKVQILTGVNSQGHSVETTMSQVVAEGLGVDIEDVIFVNGDTDSVPIGATTGGSRNAVFSGGAARMAAAEMRARLVAIASDMMEAAPEDLEIESGAIFVRGTPAQQISVAEVAARAYLTPHKLPAGLPPGLEITSRFASDGVTWSNAAHLCTCEVDPTTGQVTLLRYIVSEDCGTMINPKVVEGQICGGVVQGIGGVLLENFVYDDDGNPLTTTMMDYLLPTAADVPAIEYGHIETPSRHAGGWKGMGEGGAIAAPAAVVNAVADALSPFGVVLTSQPLSPDAIVAALSGSTGSRSQTVGP
jgi:carbon-monoxide dehydrogenase large subunit